MTTTTWSTGQSVENVEQREGGLGNAEWFDIESHAGDTLSCIL